MLAGTGLFLSERVLLPVEEMPFKLNYISFLKCSMVDADFERGIPGEGFHITRPPSIESNRGYVGHFLMPALVECSSLISSDNTREKKLPLSELSYPLLEVEFWLEWTVHVSLITLARSGLGQGA